MPKVCAPLQLHSQKAVLKQLKKLKGKADLAELWLDEIRDLDLPALLRQRALPVICRGKRAPEAGQLGAEYVDIPYPRSSSRKRGSAKLILSHHDFRRTPTFERLLALALAMRRAGASVVKIACLARSFSDAFTMIFLAEELRGRGIPHILIAMGEKGRLSRILTPHLGGTLMFAPLSAVSASAPGQLTVRQLKAAWSLIIGITQNI